jgi:XFP N-terminal domain
MERNQIMEISALAGKPARRNLLVDLALLEREYYARRPDVGDPNQLVSFGTSGPRGSSLRGTFTEAHIYYEAERQNLKRKSVRKLSAAREILEGVACNAQGSWRGAACNAQGSCKQLPSKWLRAPAQPTPLLDAPPDREFLNRSKRSKVMVTTSTKLAEISPHGPTRATVEGTPLSAEELQKMDAYWRACCYLILGMLYLRENPLLRETLRVEHIKKRLLGHWGSSPGQSFVWTHLNRVIKKYDLNMIYVSGPGHGAPGVLAPVYLEGSYSEIYPDKSEDADGMRRFFRQFSFPGGIGSHCTPETPGSIHEGGELGYSISHAYGTAFDNPDLITSCDRLCAVVCGARRQQVVYPGGRRGGCHRSASVTGPPVSRSF